MTGYLWYDEQTKKLYVSDWDDDHRQATVCQWIEVGGSKKSGRFCLNSMATTLSSQMAVSGAFTEQDVYQGRHQQKAWRVQPARRLQDHHAISRGWAKNNTVC